MSRKFPTSGAAKPQNFVERNHSHLTSDPDQGRPGLPGLELTMTGSHICPNSGKLASCATEDLRALLDQFRREQVPPKSEAALESAKRRTIRYDEVVMLDDELHGREGEWLIVGEVSNDMEVLTLDCVVTGTSFKRAANAVRGDISAGRLKVLRYGDPDVPPEWE